MISSMLAKMVSSGIGKQDSELHKIHTMQVTEVKIIYKWQRYKWTVWYIDQIDHKMKIYKYHEEQFIGKVQKSFEGRKKI